MADCNETLRELETFLDGEIGDDARASIQSHLGDCLDCLQAFDFHAELRMVISAKCRNDEMPPELLSKIELCFGQDFDGDGTIG
ncbi:MAG: zf-HC2 domain-containing protein [Ilumatobacteraceae bacterium]